MCSVPSICALLMAHSCKVTYRFLPSCQPTTKRWALLFICHFIQGHYSILQQHLLPVQAGLTLLLTSFHWLLEMAQEVCLRLSWWGLCLGESLMYLEVNVFVSNAGKQWLTGMVFVDTSVSTMGKEVHGWSGANKKFSGTWIQVSSCVFCTVLDVISIFCFPAPGEVKSADKLLHTWQ